MAEELEEQKKQEFCISLHPLSNIEITNYFNYEPRFNGIFVRHNLPKIKDGVYMIKLDDKKSKEGHWVSLIIDRNAAIYFNSLGIEYIPQELLNKIKDKSINHNIIRDNESIMCGFYCIALIEFACRKCFVRLYLFIFSE